MGLREDALSIGYRFDDAKAAGVKDEDIMREVNKRIARARVDHFSAQNPNTFGAAGAAKQAIDQFGAPLSEMLASAGLAKVGAAGGTLLSPGVGTVLGGLAGGALGAFGAKGASDIVSGQLGKVVGEEKQFDAESAAKEALMGELIGGPAGVVMGKMFKVPGIAKNAIKDYFDKRKLPEIISLFEKHGIDLRASEGIDSKLVSFLDDILKQNVFTGSDAEKRILEDQLKPFTQRSRELVGNVPRSDTVGQEIQSQVKDRLADDERAILESLGELREGAVKKYGSGLTPSGGGVKVQESIKSSSERAFKAAREKFLSVADSVPKGFVPSKNNLEKAALEISNGMDELPDSMVDPKLKSLVGWVLDKKGGPKSWRGQQQLWQAFNKQIALNDLAMGMNQAGFRFQATPPSNEYKTLKNALAADMAADAERAGGETLQKFKEANAFYAKTKPLYRNETIVAAMKANPEEVVSKAFRPGNVTGVRTLKEILPKKDFEEAQDLFINKVLEVDKMGNFDPKDLSQKISGYGKEFIYEALGDRKVEALKELVQNGIDITKRNVPREFWKTIAKAHDGEVIVNKIIGAMDTRTGVGSIIKNFDDIKSVVDEKTFERMKTLFLQKTIFKNSTLDEGLIKPSDMTSVFKKYGPVVERFYDKDTFKKMRELALIGERVKAANALVVNTSGTGQYVLNWNAIREPIGLIPEMAKKLAAGEVKQAIGTAVKTAVGTTAQVLTMRQLGNLLTSKEGVKWLYEGAKTPATSKRAAEITKNIAKFATYSAYEDQDQ